MQTVCLTCDEIVHQRDGDAEDADQQVADGQVKNEEVDYGAHVAVLYHDEADKHIPHHAQQEDEQVSQDVAGGHQQGVLVVRRDGHVAVENLQAVVQQRRALHFRLFSAQAALHHSVGGSHKVNAQQADSAKV